MTARTPGRLAVILAAALLALPASAQITFEPLPTEPDEEAPAFPVQGQPVRITLDEAADDVSVVWRPNSAIPDTVSLDADGTSFEWTPTRAGVATVVTTIGEETTAQNVSVRYDEYPGAGIFILILAATILFGGAGFAMGKLLSDEELPTLPMDT